MTPPGSARFRHYLSPAQYTARFGASAATAPAVSRWRRGAGFTGELFPMTGLGPPSFPAFIAALRALGQRA